MDFLRTAVILGLLTVGHSTPLTTVTQFPKSEDDVFREAVTDGFIVDQHFLPSLTTQAPQRDTTLQYSTAPISEVPDESEGSASGESPDVSTTPVFDWHVTSMTSTILPAQSSTVAVHSSPSTSQSPLSEDRSMSEPSEDKATEQTTLLYSHTTLSDSGSEDGGILIHDHTTSTAQITTTPVSVSPESLSTLSTNEGSGSGSKLGGEPESEVTEDNLVATVEKITKSEGGSGRSFSIGGISEDLLSKEDGIHQPQETDSGMHKGHVTPDWIIILAFVIALAALILICLAIATRDKWNGPNQSNVTIKRPVNQKRAVEMEEFLPEEHPRENGKVEEYTVIPLDELPDSYSS